jgi:hypothetical protein
LIEPEAEFPVHGDEARDHDRTIGEDGAKPKSFALEPRAQDVPVPAPKGDMIYPIL